MQKVPHTKVLLYTTNMLTCLAISVSVCLGADITSVRNGDWNVPQTWSGNVVPQEGDNVFIRPGDIITVTQTATVNSITFLNTNATQAILAINTSAVLNVIGGISLQNAANYNTNATIRGGGKVNCSYIIIGSTIKTPIKTCNSTLTSSILEMEVSGNLTIKAEVNGSNYGHSSFQLSSGTVIVKGAIVLDAAIGNTRGPVSSIELNVASGTGTLDLAGETPFFAPNSLGIIYVSLNGSNSTVKYSYRGDQKIYTANYKNLRLSGSGVKKASGEFQVNGVFTIDEGVTLDQGLADITIPSSGSLVANGTLDFTSSTGNLIPVGVTMMAMGPNGLIRTMNPVGLGKSTDASFQKSSNADWDLQSISTNGTVEYYSSANSVDDLVNTQVVTDLNYNNLIIKGANRIKRWNLGGSRTINGNLIIFPDAPMKLASENTLSIKGDWINNGVGFDPGFSVISFNGNRMQKISGSSVSLFNNLVIDNESGVLVTKGANVIEYLTLNKGLLTIPVSSNLKIENQRIFSKEVKGAPFGATKHIVTQVDQNGMKGTFQVDSILGNTSFLFPVGNGEHYLPVTIKSNGTEKNNYKVTVYTGITLDGKPGIPLEEMQRKNVVNVVWDISAIKNISADISLSWPKERNLEGVNVLNSLNNSGSLGISQFSNGQWNPASGTFDAESNSVSRTNITNFSPFAAALIGDYALPVHFSKVRVSEKPKGVQVEFTNLTESDVDHYEIERSNGGQVFHFVKKLLPVKNDYGCASYTWLDENNIEGRIVYRIKAVEVTGKIIFSNPVNIILRDKKSGMNVYAKSGQVAIHIYSLPAGQYRFNIVNAAGQVVYIEDVHHEGGAFSQTASLINVKPGIYIFCVKGPLQIQQKFIMQ